ncbi:MAG: hypothetical protein IPN81_07300 [Nitrosomonadales bacterium]|nr:hypothetical protein [Nitrosomonadales bacterium]
MDRFRTFASTLLYRTLLCFLLVVAIGAIYVGFVFWLMPEPSLSGPGTFESRSEAAFGGKTTIVAVHALTAASAAPVLAEVLLLQFILPPCIG